MTGRKKHQKNFNFNTYSRLNLIMIIFRLHSHTFSLLVTENNHKNCILYKLFMKLLLLLCIGFFLPPPVHFFVVLKHFHLENSYKFSIIKHVFFRLTRSTCNSPIIISFLQAKISTAIDILGEKKTVSRTIFNQGLCQHRFD